MEWLITNVDIVGIIALIIVLIELYFKARDKKSRKCENNKIKSNKLKNLHDEIRNNIIRIHDNFSNRRDDLIRLNNIPRIKERNKNISVKDAIINHTYFIDPDKFGFEAYNEYKNFGEDIPEEINNFYILLKEYTTEANNIVLLSKVYEVGIKLINKIDDTKIILAWEGIKKL